MTSIAAIVCGHTFDRWGDIQQAIGSLQRQTHPADQIVLSIDNNEELYAAALSEFPSILVVHNEGTRGVSAARNTAAAATSCDVLAYIDDDAVADERWIEHLIGWYGDEAVVGVGGTAIPTWDGEASGPAWFPPSFNWVVGCSHSGIAAAAAPVRNFIGCNMSVRRSTWQAVGGFDVGLGRVGADGAGGDETDFCMRIAEMVGGTIMNDPAAIVAHRVPASRQTLRYFVKRCRSEGRSKAQIAARAGTDAALSEERKHLLGELPRSFVRGLLDLFRGDLVGPSRSAAIGLGTGATVAGYVEGRLKGTKSVDGPASAFTPVSVVSIDLDEQDPTQATTVDDGPAFVIVRRGAQLLGTHRYESLPTRTDLRATMQSRYNQIVAASNPPTRTRTVTVAIATRDRAESLRRCLDSLLNMTLLADQIIVVDSAPSDSSTHQTIEDWQAATGQDLCYVRCDQPGLARAHNAALAHVSSEIVAFTDDDVVVDQYWLEQLVTGFEAAAMSPA